MPDISKIYAISSSNIQPQVLVGEFENKNGVYSFKYKLGNTAPKYWWLIDDFPDTNKEYTHEDVEKFIQARVKAVKNNSLLELQRNDITDWEIFKLYFKGGICGREPHYVTVVPKNIKRLTPQKV